MIRVFYIDEHGIGGQKIFNYMYKAREFMETDHLIIIAVIRGGREVLR